MTSRPNQAGSGIEPPSSTPVIVATFQGMNVTPIDAHQ
jgi:hypothetical protein